MNALPHNILIVGGGTAGWMTACYLARAHELQQANVATPSPCNISLLESNTIGTIGVGEGSTPYLRHFFAYLGVNEEEWMPACSATYKMGINFEGWNTPHTTTSYFHPFFSELDLTTANQFFDAVNARREGAATDVNPAHYFSAAQMVKQHIAPTDIDKKIQLDYAYHFDAGLLGEFLKAYALKKGVTHKVGTVTDVVATSENIKSVVTDLHGQLNADLFIDCSGFAGLLGKQALARPFTSFSDTLYNDAAVAIATPKTAQSAAQYQTRSVALKHGWQWEIPLTSRVGNGYVYSSQFCSKNDAEDELRQALQIGDGDARHLKMEVGRLSEHWQGNCLSIGLSQGFIEPLEATALMLVQYALHHFIDSWQHNAGPSLAQPAYNKEMNRMFDGIRDYIAAHYYLNTRTDSAYWRACRHDIKVPDTLAFLIKAWDSGERFETALNAVDANLVYLRPSWYCIFAGMQRFSHQENHAKPNVGALQSLSSTLRQHQRKP